ncbi:MAG: DMT family transporter, partial [Tabrizicola sp.]
MASPSTLSGAGLGLLAFGAYAAYDISAKFLGEGIHPMQIIAVSGLFHLPMLFALALWDRGPMRPNRPGLMALRTVGTVINFTAGVSAFTMLPLAEAYVIFFTMPLLIAILAVPVLGERFDPVRGLAVLLGLAGVVIALDPTRTPLGLGHGLAFLGASVGAMNYVIIRKTGGVERTPVMLIWPQLALVPIALAATPFVYAPMTARDVAVTAFM